MTISWSDAVGLDGDSRVIRLNGTAVTDDFSYSGTSTSATSSETITLRKGSNTLTARICDTSGNCSPTKSASYTYAPIPPEMAITFGPRSGSTLPVTIVSSDNVRLAEGTLAITFNGTDVTDTRFDHERVDVDGRLGLLSEGSVILRNGANTLVAHICDTEGECTTESRSYDYDAVAPVVRILSPPDGAVTASGFTVRIGWCDNLGLQRTSMSVTQRDATHQQTVTGAFAEVAPTHGDDCPDGDYFESEGTLTHGMDSTRLVAHICDTSGHCTDQDASYHRDATPPEVTIEPAADTTASASLPVVITWSDDWGLDGPSREVTLNGTPIEFPYSGGAGATTATSSKTIPLEPGLNTLVAEIRDGVGHSGSASAIYHYDAAAPTVNIAPGTGTFSAAENVDVTITWCDAYGLAAGSREILFNGDTLTSGFDYDPGAVTGCSGSAAVSTGRVTLRAGRNTLAASIEDGFGRRGDATVIYTVPTFGVAVTPDGTSVWATPNSSKTRTFTVENLGTGSASFSLEASCAGTAYACSASKSTLTLASGTSSPVTVSYSVGSAGTVGTVQLAARHNRNNVRDAGLINVRVSAGGSLSVEVESANPGPALARGLCVTIAAGPAAAFECGDLRLTHPLPSTRTLNKARTPVLLYNSQHAHPYPTVSAYITVPETAGVTDSVVAVLKVGSAQRARRAWANANWSTAHTRRITLAFDGLNDATGLYAYTLEVMRWSGGTPDSATASGELVIVNRKDSPFGAGWWLAGLERIVGLGGSKKLWIGGDGSFRVYAPVSANLWVAPTLTRPDTLKYDGTDFTRVLPGGDTVRYNAAGRHVATTNRLGQRTSFSYDNGRLGAIALPVPSGSRTYTFVYDDNDKLDKIYAPPRFLLMQLAQRITHVTVSGGRMTDIMDPGGHTVRFSYGTFANRVTRRTDRRGNVAAYGFDVAGKLSRVRRYMSGASAASGDLITNFVTLERRTYGFPHAWSNAYTRVDGPRTDVGDTTRFYPDRWGAPMKIKDALGGETLLQRTDGRFPALVTRIVYPVQDDGDGEGTRRVQLASYDARGNIESVTEVDPYGDGRNATTRYGYDNTAWPDFATRIVPPMRDSVVIGYDANGNRQWQQDARGSASRVYFRYHNSGPGKGLLAAIDPPLAAPDSLFYDGYGNLRRTKSAMGFVTDYLKDSIGRDTLILTPTDSAQTAALRQKQRIRYDAMDRVRLAETIGPAMNGAPQQTRFVRNFYNPEGALDSVWTWSDPDPAGIDTLKKRWVYDRAGRVVKDVAYDGQADSTVYDPAGNPVRVITRRGDTIIMEYDALNRLRKRKLPAVTYAERNQGIPTLSQAVVLDDPLTQPDHETKPYPRYPNDGAAGYRIAADSALFDYDALGHITEADNGDARVRRTYYPGGALKTETQMIRTVTGSDFSQHIYRLEYHYDLNGRRTDLIHPADLRAGAPRTRTSYLYHPQTGALETVVDLLGNVFTYGYDAAGRLSSLALPGGIGESYGYDADGRLRLHRVINNSTSPQKWGEPYLRSTTLRYDGRGKITHTLNGAGTRDTLAASYNGLGSLVSSRLRSYGRNLGGGLIQYTVTESFAYDALANFRNSHSEAVLGGRTTRRGRVQGYVAGTGRLAYAYDPEAQRDTFHYDPAGNIVFSTQTLVGFAPVLQDRASYYAADGTLRAADHRMLSDVFSVHAFYRTAFEEYRYDALGRRVWVRARRWCKNDPDSHDGLCRISTIRRIIWDGEQVLYEIQMPGADSSAYLENDAVQVVLPSDTYRTNKIDPNPFFGRVAYTHGLALDQPLSVIRMGYGDLLDESNIERAHRSLAPFAIMPLWSANGQADNGVFADGGMRKCQTTGGVMRCVYLGWPAYFYAYARQDLRRTFWHGSLIEDQKDAAGTFYRRNRYYDPSTGRFTQEDPIGIAGGLNLYGFANGDPVNFSDPFGLWPSCPSCTTMVSAAATDLADALTPDSGELESTWFDPVAFLAAGIAGGLRCLGARLLGSRIATETATVGELTLTHGRTLSRREMVAQPLVCKSGPGLGLGSTQAGAPA